MIVPLVLVVAAMVLGVTAGPALFPDRVAGKPAAVLEDVPGPETGPVCPLDGRYVDEPATGLRPAVRDAWRRLRAAAAEHGARLCVQDGKRSAAQQQHEFDDAVRRFGSAEMAERYVLPPEKSMHVQGIAVDVQPFAAASWVADNGAALGWCRRYRNEYWHFEYDPDYATAGCPTLSPSATGF